MSGLVTGEAVALGLRAAKLPSRALALLLDLAVEWAGLAGGLIVLAFAAPGLDGAAAAAISLGMTVGFLVGVPVLVETLSRGRSLGKLALGLRVVRADGGPVRFRHALVRGLVGFIELLMLMGVPAVICSLASAEGRRLGDVFAGTLVVRERVPGAGRPVLPALPPQLAHLVGAETAGLDLSAVPDGLWLALRQYLGRLGQLDQAVAARMGQQLIGEVVARTGREVPYGVPPVAYLGAVLAERQRREWAQAVGRPAAPPVYQQQQQRQQPYAAAPAPAPEVEQRTEGGFAPPA
ncbi:RDD family protein [Kitasatospora sp. MMS16-BH015]|uniref:RDD family protein n=1 Tax=Kitasatospora sp. MMS16-BH015 TaxID=2018025 RepID=UPI000CA2B0DD|nr:RDD family protein [Kitasatospora sp. MMS16-BH015]AUG77543.1 RDD family protein [Kitasatospora sp. MMS16-BH015]